MAESVDPKSIGFTIPTLAKDDPIVEPIGEVISTDLAFHEDGWRQIEFFSEGRREEVRKALSELKLFEKAYRVGNGYWTGIYQRELSPAPILEKEQTPETLALLLAAIVGRAPILFYGQGVVVGRITNGFTILLGRGASLYGVRDATGISILAADLQNADDQVLWSAFMELNKAYGLLMVDWRAQRVCESVAKDGQIVFWRP
jgi:hypothetical protein